ncbi:peptidase [Yersinia kristensenii]|uniref:Peptidase n=1 Tax=Yersinia kristensenii TaxID=28152 RepID=A0AB73Q852_YERKR|nr:peptidase [Yersinia kristensenii]OVZ82195.1 peptidase [Yersinia kristensenii]
MNLFQQLLMRRLCSEASVEGDAGGGGPAATTDASATTTVDVTDPAGTPAEGDADKTAAEPGAKTEAELAAEKEATEKANKEKKESGAPEKYEFKATAEGQDLDAEALATFEPVARELGLSQEQAQKLVDIYGKDIVPKLQQKQAEAWQQQTEQWGNDVKADKEIGGDKLTANIGMAQKALDQFGTPELRTYLEQTGLGNHPDLVRFCVKIGKSMGEDSMVMAANGGQRSAAEVLYGNK